MIDALGQDAPDVVDQAELDASLTLHEAKRLGYWPGETPGTAEEYLAISEKIEEIDARWRAKFVEARERGAANAEIRWMNRAHASEIHEQDGLWLHSRKRSTPSMRGRVVAQIDALF